jgi:hypothetical protein
VKKTLTTEKIKNTGTPIASEWTKQEWFVIWGLPALQFSQTSLFVMIRMSGTGYPVIPHDVAGGGHGMG